MTDELRTFQDRFNFSNLFLPHIREIIGQMLFRKATDDEDIKQATDLVILNVSGKKIMCRIRHMRQIEYKGQFTLRHKPGGQYQTEFEKVMDGFGDWMIYGFGDEKTKRLRHWWLLDMDKFRKHINAPHPVYRGGHQVNPDGTEFNYYHIKAFKPTIVLASSEPVHLDLFPFDKSMQFITQKPDGSFDIKRFSLDRVNDWTYTEREDKSKEA